MGRLFGSSPMLRSILEKVPQGVPQLQRSPVIARIDVLPALQQPALTQPSSQQAWRLDLVAARVGNPVFHKSAPVEAVCEFVQQRELRRYGVFL